MMLKLSALARSLVLFRSLQATRTQSSQRPLRTGGFSPLSLTSGHAESNCSQG